MNARERDRVAAVVCALVGALGLVLLVVGLLS